MDISGMNNNVTNINNIRFSDTWKGSASEVQTESLNNFMTDLNQCISDISAFDAILPERSSFERV